MSIDETVAASRASQNKTELKLLLKFVSEIQPKVVVEIGLHRGYSLLDWYRAFKPELLIGVEIDTSQLDQEALAEIRAGAELIILDGDSTSEEVRNLIKEKLNGKEIDFLYIDGDHHYECVKSDFRFYSDLVRKGGIVGLDDIMLTDYKYVDSGVEVNRFWIELVAPAGTKSYVFWDETQISGFGTGDGVWIKPEKPLQLNYE